MHENSSALHVMLAGTGISSVSVEREGDVKDVVFRNCLQSGLYIHKLNNNTKKAFFLWMRTPNFKMLQTFLAQG